MSERGGDQKEVEIDKGQENSPCPGGYQFVADRPESLAVMSDRHHGTGVVMEPPDEKDSQSQPEHGWQPSPLQGNYRPDDGSSSGNRVELETIEDIPVGRHEVNTVHIHLGRCRLVWICLIDSSTDPSGINKVANANDDCPENEHQKRVHLHLPPFKLML